MADIPTFPIDPRAQKSEQEALKEYLNVQKEIEKSYQNQSNSLLEQFGIRKDLSIGLLQTITRSRELSKLVNESKAKEAYLTSRLAVIQNETRRRELQQAIDSLKQRREGYTEELALLRNIQLRAWLPLLFMIRQAYQLFLRMDKAAFDFRIQMGFTRDSAKDLRSMAQNVAIEFMSMGVTIQGVYNTIKALGREMGSVHAVSKDLVQTTALLKSQLGVSEEDSAGFLRNMAAVSKSTMQAQQSMAYVAADFAQTAGVPLPQIMKDIATKSSVTLTMMSRLPNQAIRSAVELRRMGTSLGESAKASRELLNFSDNINAELEASVLLGKSINLQRARELAYRRDLEGSTKEILRITKQISFEQLDVFQQEAFARATGRSVDELLRMVQAERQWEAARRDPTLSMRVQAYEQLRAANQDIVKSRAKDLEYLVMTRSNQERINSITLKWQEIIAKASAFLLPIVDNLLSIVPPLLNFLPIVMSVSGFIVKGVAGLGKWGALFAKFAGPFAKLLGPIGWVIMAFQAISGFIKGWNESTGAWYEKLGSGVVGALRGIIPFFDQIVGALKWVWDAMAPIITFLWKWTTPLGLIVQGVKWLKGAFPAIKDAIVGAFKGAWDFVKGLWGGHSPSEVGLSILRGIISVGPMMFDALTAPFRRGLAWIADKIPGMGKVAEKLRGGIGGIINKPIETRAAAAYVPAVTVTPRGTRIAGAPEEAPRAGAEKAAEPTNDKVLGDILTAINQLNKNLESGKIGIYLDGQLMSATLARQTEFRGGYGVNKV